MLKMDKQNNLTIQKAEKAKGEVILYQPNDTIRLEVRMEDETVWLTQAQMASLFQTTRNNITLHIRHIFDEGELDRDSVCKESLLTANDNKAYKTTLYNLDIIISVGYRVKSIQGTRFRQWANRVLKEYLLRGYALNQRVERLEQRVSVTEEKIDFFVRTSLPPVEGVFCDGQIFDAFHFTSDLIRSAKQRVILIDNFIDDSVLTILDKQEKGVTADIITKSVSQQLQLDLCKHNAQYSPIAIRQSGRYHDRFLIIDDKVYHLGASMKDLGKKLFAFSRMDIPIKEVL